MKILCRRDEGGSVPVRTGWGRVFLACGHAFFFWDARGKSAHDVFAEVEPDIYLGTTYSVDRALSKCIQARPHLRVALFASAWGDLVDDLDRQEFPLDFASPAEVRAVEQLKQWTGQPEFVFLHAPERFLPGVLGGWTTLGLKTVSVLNAADTFAYLGGQCRPEYQSDINFVGGCWPYKARNLELYLYPLCHPSLGLTVKIWGHSPHPVANYLGPLPPEEERHVLASARVGVNISEPHSTCPHLGYDLVERLFKVPAAGTCLVSDHVEALNEVFGPGLVPTARTPQEFHELVQHYCNDEQQRLQVIQRLRPLVLSRHTYWERVQTILENLGLPEEARKVQEKKDQWLNRGETNP